MNQLALPLPVAQEFFTAAELAQVEAAAIPPQPANGDDPEAAGEEFALRGLGARAIGSWFPASRIGLVFTVIPDT